MKLPKLKNLLIGFLILVFLMRLHLALARAFDPDEFAHLHWAWLVKSGQLPYRDFFFYNTPLFQFILAPFFFLPEGAGVVLVFRILELLVLILLGLLIYLIVQKLHLSQTAGLFSFLVLAVFPMNMDKLIDIRPDVWMLTFYFLAVYLLLKYPLTNRLALSGGVIVAASALIMPKIVFALPALIYLYFLKGKNALAKIPYVIAGGLLMALLTLLPVLFSGSLPAMLTAVFADSVAVNAGKTPFSPWKALSPWPLVYVEKGGPSFPWYVNSGIWVTAFIGFLIYFFKFPRIGTFFLLYALTGLIFLFAFPAPYLQYFLPLSVVASIMSAFLLADFLPKANQTARTLIIVSATILLGSAFLIQYRLRVSPGWSNLEQLTVLNDISHIIRPEETVYDMVGSYVFRSDAYIFCCHPYAEFIDRLGRPFPTLKESIIRTGTKFVILDRTGMAFWQPKPDDLAFIERHFVESPYRKIYFAGQQFRCQGGSCQLLNVHGHDTGMLTNIIEIFVGETYEIITDPPGQTLTVNGNQVSSSIDLQPGSHRLSVSPQVIKVIFRIKR